MKIPFSLSDPLGCQDPANRLPYLVWHEDADRRMKSGEHQVFCQTCERWRWQDELCDKAEVSAIAQQPNEGDP